jgi:hypothetical protein
MLDFLLRPMEGESSRSEVSAYERVRASGSTPCRMLPCVPVETEAELEEVRYECKQAPALRQWSSVYVPVTAAIPGPDFLKESTLVDWMPPERGADQQGAKSVLVSFHNHVKQN